MLKKIHILAAAIPLLALSARALDGQVGIHDPSTVVQCDGKWYVWGTGGGGLVSDDGWTWRTGTRLGRGGLAPDVVHIGDNYFVYVAGNNGGQPHGQINLITSKSLDPASPDYKWVEGGLAASSDGIEDCNAIDPGAFLDPTDGKLWLTYGSYFGYIRLVELDPKTGKPVDPTRKPVDLAVNCEASDMIYQDGWYYLLATHGSCCQGANSGYNIRMGRSRKVTGPFIDDEGVDMTEGGGKQLIGSGGRFIGPGHFGRIDLGDGVQKFSMHWEADLDRGGASVLDIRPLLWKDGWPVAGENLQSGTYQIASVRSGTALELDVEGMAVGGGRGPRGGGPGRPRPGAMAGTNAPGFNPQAAAAPGAPGTNGPTRPFGGFGGGGRGMFGGTGGVIAPQEAAQVSSNWPAGDVATRLANYLCEAQQKWTVTAVTNAGGFLGSPFFKITIAGTDRALAATDDAELVTVPAFTGEPNQLWQVDQLADGSYRVMPKAVPNHSERLALAAIGNGFATLATFDPTGHRDHWWFKAP
jgi:arabinan endo-1,5-alpha-L-arabinosidase